MPRAKIATRQAKFTLEKLHAEIAGKLIDNATQRKRLVEAMRHVEAVLKLLVPGYNVRPIAVRRRKPNPWFKRGSVLRAALDALRTADKPLTAREITLRMLAAKGIKDAPAKPVRDLVGGVNSSLRNYNGRAVISDGRMPARWTIKT